MKPVTLNDIILCKFQQTCALSHITFQNFLFQETLSSDNFTTVISRNLHFIFWRLDGITRYLSFSLSLSLARAVIQMYANLCTSEGIQLGFFFINYFNRKKINTTTFTTKCVPLTLMLSSGIYFGKHPLQYLLTELKPFPRKRKTMDI